MDKQVELIPAGAGAAQAFLNIMFDCWRGTVAPDSTAFRETPQTLGPALAPSGYGLLLRFEGVVIGCGRYVVVPGPAGAGRDWIEAKRVGVLAAHRKSGLGQVIHDGLEAHARAQGFGGAQLAVRSDQPRLVRYWRSLGYREADDVQLTTVNPRTAPPTHMRKFYDALA